MGEEPTLILHSPLRIRLGVDPRHNPRRPSEATIPLETLITDTRIVTLDNASWLDVTPDLPWTERVIFLKPSLE